MPRENLWSCGLDEDGELGHEPNATRVEKGAMACPKPRKVRMKGLEFQQVRAGHAHAVALEKHHGKARVFGQGLPASMGMMLDVDVPIVQASCGYAHAAVIGQDGLARALGSDEFGQCASDGKDHIIGQDKKDGEANLLLSKVMRGMENVKAMQIACGHFHTLITTADGTVLTCGRDVKSAENEQDAGKGICRVEGLWGIYPACVSAGEGHSAVISSHGDLFTWGRDRHGQLGHGEGAAPGISSVSPSQGPVPESTSQPLPSPMESNTLGGLEHGVVHRAKGRVNQRMLDTMMEMGIEKANAEEALEQTGSLGVEMALEWLYAGERDGRTATQEAASRSNRSIVPFSNAAAVHQRSSALNQIPRRVFGVRRAVLVQCGGSHTAVLTDEGNAFTFGLGRHGQLGHGITANVCAPREVISLRDHYVADVACGMHHTVFLTSTNRIFTCGSGEFGQLAHDDMQDKLIPVEVCPSCFEKDQGDEDITITSVAAGSYCTFFLSVEEFHHGGVQIDGNAVLEALHQTVRLWQASQGTRGELELEASIDFLFGSAAALIKVFGTFGSYNIDAKRLEDCYKGLLATLDEKVVVCLQKSTARLCKEMEMHKVLLNSPERAGIIFCLMMNPLVAEPKLMFLPRICKIVSSISKATKEALVYLWSRSCPVDILATRVVRPLRRYITSCLEIDPRAGEEVIRAISVLGIVEEANQSRVLDADSDILRALPVEEFYNDLISERFDAFQDYVHWRRGQELAATTRGSASVPFTFCAYPFLLDSAAKSRVLHAEAHIQQQQSVHQARIEQVFGALMGMQRAPGSVASLRQKSTSHRRDTSTSRSQTEPQQAADRGFFESLRGIWGPAAQTQPMEVDEPEPADQLQENAGERLHQTQSIELLPPSQCGVPAEHPDLCIIRVRRDHLVEDALDELARQHPNDLFKPLRVHFIGEEGVDAGGVRKEFFQLVLQVLFRTEYDLFAFFPESRMFWFNPTSLESKEVYMLVGLIIGIAVYNQVILDVHFPSALYKKLLGVPVGLPELKELDPTVGKSLESLLQFSGPGSVEEVFCLSFAMERTVYGETHTVDLKPGGSQIPVTNENREEYMSLYVEEVLNRGVTEKFDAFAKGFLLLIGGGGALHIFRPQEVERLVCGTPHLDFKALQRAAKYEGYNGSEDVIKWLWTTVHSYSIEDQKHFLKFLSGSDRSPIGGLIKLPILIQRAGSDTNRLPTAHTCFNTLLLPQYSSEQKLKERLTLAIQNAVGFGLQ